MKASELRIGNFIDEGIVNHIDDYGIMVSGSSICYDANKCFPIPLTEEWLLKFGFHITEAKNCYCIQSDRYSLHYFYVTLLKDGENIFTLGDEYSTTKHLTIFTTPIVQFVHQLQNLFFALTGKELPEHVL